MKIVVCVKHVPDATGDRHFRADGATDRSSADNLLSELDEYAAEQALNIAESHGGTEICYLTMGPEPAIGALRRALAMGGDRAVQVTDDALLGVDALGTSAVLAAAIRALGFDLVICGMASTDGSMGVMPAMLAERLAVAQATMASQVIELADGAITVRRDNDLGSITMTAPLPAVVSVTDLSGEPRYPSLKNTMAARRKPVQTWSLGDLGVDPSEVGLAGAAAVVQQTQLRPSRQAGTVTPDQGDGGVKLAEFLAQSRII
ncbi:MAG: electron transfer flavoprotein subunit beta/FixA family protein [Micromonosporaceae bacterium]